MSLSWLLPPVWSTWSLLFFLGWLPPKSSSSQSSAKYSFSETRADLLLEDTAGVLDSSGCGDPWRRVLELPRPLMALWYSARAKTDVAVFSRAPTDGGMELLSLLGATSLWLWAAGKLFRGRTGRRGLMGESGSLSSEQLLLLCGIDIKLNNL